MKTVSQIYVSLLAYSARRAFHQGLILYLTIQACGLLFLVAGVRFLFMELVVLVLSGISYAGITLFFFLQEFLNSAAMRTLAKKRNVNPLSACRDFLHQEASRKGLHMRDPRVYRKARIFFSERILTRTLLKLEG